MTNVSLAQVALFLAAAVVAAPLAKFLRIGTVLGYLLVGVVAGKVLSMAGYGAAQRDPEQAPSIH